MKNNVIYKGYKIRVRCLDWEQINTLDRYWKTFTNFIETIIENKEYGKLGKITKEKAYIYEKIFDYYTGVEI